MDLTMSRTSSLRRKITRAQHSLQQQLQSPAQRGRLLVREASLPGSKDLAELACLLLLCGKLRRRVLSSNSLDRGSSNGESPRYVAQEEEEPPPAYKQVDDEERSSSPPPPHSALDPQSPSSVSRCKELIWNAYLYRAVLRLQRFVNCVLPHAAGAKSEEKEFGSARPLPARFLPPLDVCIVWVALVAQVDCVLEPGRSDLAEGAGMTALDDWIPPITQVATYYDTTTCRLRKDTDMVEDMVDPETMWERLTGTHFYAYEAIISSSSPSQSGPSGDCIPRSLIVACPQPECPFKAPIDILPCHSEDPTSILSLRRSQRGLVQTGWRRGCKQCGASALVELDTIVGASLIANLERWCQDESFSFGGLEHDFESGLPLPRCYTHAIAAHLLTPLFGNALSSRRRAANERYVKEALSLRKSSDKLPPLPNIAALARGESETKANSLSSAMHAVALETISTTASELGATCDYHIDKIMARLKSDVLLSQPRIYQSRTSSSSSRRTAQTPQTYGGGIGSSGPTFSLGNSLEEGQATATSAMMAAREEAYLSGLVHSLMRPYYARRSTGIIGASLTLRSAEATSISEQRPFSSCRNEVLLGVSRPVKQMLLLASQLDRWATAHVQSSSTSLSFSQRATNDYVENLESLAINEGDRLRSKAYSANGGGGGGSRANGDGWITIEERNAIESQMSPDDCFGARLGWTAHVLFRGRRSYTRDMVDILGLVPRHSWKKVTDPGSGHVEDEAAVEEAGKQEVSSTPPPLERLKSWLGASKRV